jgi:hypothetical protein
MKAYRPINQILSAVLLLALATGCVTYVRTVAVQQPVLPQGQVLPRHAVLVLDQSLADYQYVFKASGNTVIYPCGPALQNYARQVAKKCFQQVDEAPSIEKAVAFASADLILIPRPVKCDMSVPVWAWENVNMTMVVEWTAKDRASQNTLWLKTITATGSAAKNMGRSDLVMNQNVFDDLSLKTYNAIQEAPELK